MSTLIRTERYMIKKMFLNTISLYYFIKSSELCLGKCSVTLLDDGGRTYVRGLTVAGCRKQQTGPCGVPWPMSSSGLLMMMIKS